MWMQKLRKSEERGIKLLLSDGFCLLLLPVRSRAIGDYCEPGESRYMRHGDARFESVRGGFLLYIVCWFGMRGTGMHRAEGSDTIRAETADDEEIANSGVLREELLLRPMFLGANAELGGTHGGQRRATTGSSATAHDVVV